MFVDGNGVRAKWRRRRRSQKRRRCEMYEIGGKGVAVKKTRGIVEMSVVIMVASHWVRQSNGCPWIK